MYLFMDQLSSQSDTHEDLFETIDQRLCNHSSRQQPLNESPLAFVDNRQGYLTLENQNVSTLNCFELSQPSSFASLLAKLEKSDFSSLYQIWSDEYVSKLGFALNNWKQYSPNYAELFQNFINICEKIYNGPMIESYFPGFRQFTHKISNKLSKPLKGGLMGQSMDNPNNFFFNKYIQEQKLKANKEGSLFLIGANNTKKSIGQHVADSNLFAQNREVWKHILFVATCLYRYNKEVTNFKDIHEQIDRVYEFADLALTQRELTQPCDRLCCAKFFYLYFDLTPITKTNVLCRSRLQRLRPYLPADKKQKGRNNNQNKRRVVEQKGPEGNQLDETMLDVCALLNRGGGVVLFNVEQEYLQLRPQGESLIKKDMEAYKSLIIQSLQKITPRVTNQKEIVVSFVPLVKNPYEYGYIKEVLAINEDDRNVNRFYVDGLYVLRIAVKPTRKQHTYFYTTSNSQIKSAVYENGKRRVLMGQEIVREIKQKFSFYSVQAQDEQLQFLLSKDFSKLEQGHVCESPYDGRPIFQEQQPLRCESPDSNFKYMSLMIAGHNYSENVKKILWKKGIKTQIYKAFEKYKFKAAMNSAPIFHDIRFDQLLSEVAYKPEFKFDNRHTLIIKVTEHLKFLNRISDNYLLRNDFDTLQKWLDKEFPGEKLEYWTFVDDDNVTEHYLKTGSRLSTVFIYYVMYHFDEKTMFKDPKSDRATTPEEKKLRMKRIYQSEAAPTKEVADRDRNKIQVV